MNIFKTLLLVLCAALLSSCGGTSNSTSVDSNITVKTGHYTGTITSSNDGNRSVEAVVIKSDRYHVWMRADGASTRTSNTFHEFTPNNNSYSATTCSFFGFQTSDNCIYTGIIKSNTINGNYALNSVLNSYDNGLYNLIGNVQSITVEELSGKTLTSMEKNATITFTVSGDFVSQDTNNCKTEASYSASNSSENVLAYTMTISNCSLTNGSYAYYIVKRNNNEYLTAGIKKNRTLWLSVGIFNK